MYLIMNVSAPGYCGIGAGKIKQRIFENLFHYYIILTGKSEKNYAVVTPESGWGYCTDDLKCKLKGLLSYSGFS